MQVAIGKGLALEIEVSELPQAALDHVIYIGLRNILMDAHASVTATEFPDENERQAAAQAVAEKKLEALMRGEVRVASTRIGGDPVRAEALRMAVDMVKAKIRKAGRRVSDYEPKAIREAATKLVTPELLATATERVAQAKAIAGDAGDDLAELGL